MSISSISNNLYYNYLTRADENSKADTGETASAMLGGTSASAKTAYAAYGSNMYSGVGQSAMQRAIDELKEANGGKVTFGMVTDYRAELEEDFKKTMQLGLYAMGFEETEDFQMVASPEGKIEVLCDDAELKAAVEYMLQEMPELGEQFLYIQALGNIERAGSSMSSYAQTQQAVASLQADAMDILLNGGNFLNQISSLGIGYSALMANYSESDIQYMLGANYLV